MKAFVLALALACVLAACAGEPPNNYSPEPAFHPPEVSELGS
jgi:hypothetical protein